MDLVKTINKLFKLLQSLQPLQIGCTTPNGTIPDAYRIPRALTSLFRDLVLFLILDSISTSVGKNESTPRIEQTPDKWQPRLFARDQAPVAYSRCESSLKESKAHLMLILQQNPADSSNSNFDLISGEDIAVQAFANLQNKLLTDQDDFLLTETHAEYAMRLVSRSPSHAICSAAKNSSSCHFPRMKEQTFPE